MTAVEESFAHKQSPPPSLNGDFLLYSDRSDQYWSGFFSSRPLLKYLIRRLQSDLRYKQYDIIITVVFLK